jgi:uncharacterized protein YlxW (UPF0749 family)
MKDKITAQVAIGIVCALLGFAVTLQMRSVIKNTNSGNIVGSSREIQAMYQKERDKNEALYKELAKVQSDLDKQLQAIQGSNTTTKLLKEQLDAAEIIAGKKEVTGQGISVKMSDGIKTAPLGVDASLFWLHDADILSVVNELRDAGAEAISVNEQRLTSISEIRCVGAMLSVNNVRVGEPFMIKAIGDSKALESALLFKGGIVSELTTYGIEFEIKKSEKITVPAYNGAINFKYAVPVTKE